MTERSISPGAVWNDADGNPIQAHGGSVIEVDGIFYWYGENKEHTGPATGSGIGASAATPRPNSRTGPTAE